MLLFELLLVLRQTELKLATTQVPAVGALHLVFQRMLGMVRSKFLLGGLFMVVKVLLSLSLLLVLFVLLLLELFGLRSFP